MPSPGAHIPSEPAVKGVAFRTTDACFEELCGSEARARAHALMPVELAQAYQYGTLLAASWYPISWYRHLFRAFRSATGTGLELPRRLGRLAARHDMSGVHRRLFAQIVSPQLLLSLSQRLFRTYYDTGKFEIVESRAGFIRAECSECSGWDENMWHELVGSCESQLEIAGAKNIRLRIVSGGQNYDSEAVLEARWT